MATRAVKTVDIDACLLEGTRSAMRPAPEAADAEVVERAQRSYLGRRALDVDAVSLISGAWRGCGS